MSYTSNQLISSAFYTSGVVGKDFQTVAGGQLSDGLVWLNEILAEKRVEGGMVPYETTFRINTRSGVEKYFIPGLISIDTMVFYLNSVRYSMQYTKRNAYFGSSRVDNIKALPYSWYFERITNGSNIYIYFPPDQNYNLEIHGIFDLDPVDANEDLTNVVTTANLGSYTIFSEQMVDVYGQNFIINAGQLVVNNYDLSDLYINIGTLVNKINTGVIPGVRASIVNNQFVLSSTTEPPEPIYVTSIGFPPSGCRFISTVTAATTANLPAIVDLSAQTLTSITLGPLVVDGFTISQVNQQTVLVKNQQDPSFNGVYVLIAEGSATQPWILKRTNNYNQTQEIQIGDLFKIQNGNTLMGITYRQTSDIDAIGLDDIIFEKFSSVTFSNFSTIDSFNYNVYNALGFDQFYLTYLKFALANRICAEYNIVTPPNVLQQLSKYESMINKKSRVIDLSAKKVSTLQKGTGYGWIHINLARGWSAE